jgi:hypothetical protein
MSAIFYQLDMVWFGGLTGVQARLQVEGAQALVQRALDEEFHTSEVEQFRLRRRPGHPDHLRRSNLSDRPAQRHGSAGL